MPKKIINQTAFTNGEITPKLYGHVEVEEYKRGVETALNSRVLPHGPIVRRNGSQFIAEIKDSSAEVRLVKYQLSSTVAYILEFGNLYIRFFTEGGQVVESSKTITGITQANPGVITSNSHGFSNGDQVYITSVAGMTQINNTTIPYKVANVTANTFTVQTLAGTDINTTGYTAYSSGGVANRIYTLVSPYSTAQVQEIEYIQSNDSLYIVHPSFAPRVLTSASATSWSLDVLALSPPPTYESGYLSTGVTMTPSATTGTSINFTASGALFLNGDVGRQIVNLTTGQTGRASIISVTSTTVAVCDIIENFTNTSAIASANWMLDLSPIVNLEIDASQVGAIANIRSEYTTGSLGSRVSISAITKANPGVVTTGSNHNLINGDKIQIQDIVGMTQLNNKIFTIDNQTATTFELKGEDTTNYTTYSSGGIVRKKLDDIANPAFRSADVGKYILMNGGVLQIVSVNSSTDVDAEILKSLNDIDTTSNWTLEVDTWSSTRGYPKAIGVYEQRLVFGGTSAQPQTLWFSEVGIFDGFGAGPDEEDSIEIDLVSNEVNTISWLFATRDLIVGTSGGELTINSGSGVASISPSNIRQQPRTPYGSAVQQVAAIGEEVLFIQTSGRKIRTFRYDFNVDGYVGEELTFLAEHITEDGISELAYAQDPESIVYAITSSGMLIMGTYDRSKKVIAWTKADTDGYYENVQTITRNANDEVWVVVRRKINGSYKRYVELFDNTTGEDDTDGFSDCYLTYSNPLTITNITNASLAVVSSTSHGLSNGDTIVIKGLVDPLDADLDPNKTNMSELNQGVYTVSGVAAHTFALSGINTTNYNAYSSGGEAFERITSISGLSHLEGKTVQVKGDGGVQASKVVSSGAITAATPAGEIVIGLPYTTTIKLINIEFDLGLGSMQGQSIRWTRPLLKVYKSGPPTINGAYYPSRNAANIMGQRVPLFSGNLEYGSLTWSNTASLTVEITDPLPLQLLSVSGTIDAGVK